MPLLTVHDFWDVLMDPSWIMFGLTFLVGGLGLLALILLYPLGRD
jgi:hypothetical protein